MNSQSELSLVKKLTAIATFLPAFQEGKDLSSLDQFVDAAYANNWVSGDINWGEWMKTDEMTSKGSHDLNDASVKNDNGISSQ